MAALLRKSSMPGTFTSILFDCRIVTRRHVPLFEFERILEESCCTLQSLPCAIERAIVSVEYKWDENFQYQIRALIASLSFSMTGAEGFGETNMPRKGRPCPNTTASLISVCTRRASSRKTTGLSVKYSKDRIFAPISTGFT